MSYFYCYSFPLPILNIMSHYPYAYMQIITQLIFFKWRLFCSWVCFRIELLYSGRYKELIHSFLHQFPVIWTPVWIARVEIQILKSRLFLRTEFCFCFTSRESKLGTRYFVLSYTQIAYIHLLFDEGFQNNHKLSALY